MSLIQTLQSVGPLLAPRAVKVMVMIIDCYAMRWSVGSLSAMHARAGHCAYIWALICLTLQSSIPQLSVSPHLTETFVVQDVQSCKDIKASQGGPF